jgi:valyl-tRNA synthetase
MFSDGKKTSKSLKIYPGPSLILDRYGADATRFVHYRSFAWVICLRQRWHRQDVSRELTYSLWRQSTISRRGRARRQQDMSSDMMPMGHRRIYLVVDFALAMEGASNRSAKTGFASMQLCLDGHDDRETDIFRS